MDGTKAARHSGQMGRPVQRVVSDGIDVPGRVVGSRHTNSDEDDVCALAPPGDGHVGGWPAGTLLDEGRGVHVLPMASKSWRIQRSGIVGDVFGDVDDPGPLTRSQLNLHSSVAGNPLSQLKLAEAT